MNDQVQVTVITLAAMFLPYLGLVAIVTEFITGLTGWDGKVSKITSSIVGLVLGGLIVLAFFVPSTAVYVGSVMFLLMSIAGPSGGYDLITKFAQRVGKGE